MTKTVREKKVTISQLLHETIFLLVQHYLNTLLTILINLKIIITCNVRPDIERNEILPLVTRRLFPPILRKNNKQFTRYFMGPGYIGI